MACLIVKSDIDSDISWNSINQSKLLELELIFKVSRSRRDQSYSVGNNWVNTKFKNNFSIIIIIESKTFIIFNLKLTEKWLIIYRSL